MDKKVYFYLSYDKSHNSPADMFLAMSHYLNSYRILAEALFEAVQYEDQFKYHLEYIEDGSILAVIKANIDRITNPHKILKDFKGETKGISDVKRVSQIHSARIDTEMQEQQRIEPYIGDYDIALAMKSFSDGNSLLNDRCSFNIGSTKSKAKKEKSLDYNYKFNANINEIFKSKISSFQSQETVQAYRTCTGNDSKWEFVFSSNGQRFRAEMCDKDFLEQYRASDIRLGGNDYYRVEMTYDLIRGPKGKHIRNAKIIKVLGITQHGGQQYELR